MQLQLQLLDRSAQSCVLAQTYDVISRTLNAVNALFVKYEQIQRNLSACMC